MEKNKFLPKVFGWMFLGLLVTFLSAWIVSNNETMIYNIFSTNMYWFICIIEIVVVLVLSARAHKMNYMTSVVLFMVYSLLTGLTFSILFLMFELTSILGIFAITSAIFGLFAFIGYTTKVDLGKFSTLLMMFLMGGLIATVVNMFLQNSMFDIILNWFMIAVFIGFTAYDIQKLNRISHEITDSNRLAIVGALTLYLDFINLFIRILSLFGKSRD